MIDDARQIDLMSHTLRASVCIVGAGAAGITLACELDALGVQTLLLEAGQVTGSGAVSQDPYEGGSDGAHATPRHFRRRGFGGTTAIWGGRCVPYDPIDFQSREHVADSGWPIGYREVAQHYPKAMSYCDAGAFDFSASSALEGDEPPAGAWMRSEGGLNADGIERYSLPTDFGRRYRARLAASRHVRVLGPVQVTRLLRARDGIGVDAVLCRVDEHSRAFRVEADRFVIATGGIEAPRLLLASQGLGNRYDNVGRYYTCHVENFIGAWRPRRPGTPFNFETTQDGVYARRKLMFDATVQRRERLLNTSFRLHYPNVADAAHRSAVLSAVYLGRRTLIPEYRRILQYGVGEHVRTSSPLAHLRNVVGGLPQLAAFGADWTRRRMLARRKLPYVLAPNADGSFVLEFNAEQTPLRDSRITLSDRLDAFGVPRVHVAWRFSRDDVETLCRTVRLLREQLLAQEVGLLDFDDDALRETIAASVPLGGHHIGATRMAASPRNGVVDRDLALFDAPNVFIASASVFPTSSHANPTLTIVAMAIRLAAHLGGRIASERASRLAREAA